MKNLILLILTVYSVTGLTMEIVCHKDIRPVDGPYFEIKLEQKSGRYDLITKKVTSGFGHPVQTPLKPWPKMSLAESMA